MASKEKGFKMEITFDKLDFDGEHLAPIVDGKEYTCYFKKRGMAIVYAGLIDSGISANDASHLSRYISYSVDGILKDK